MRATLTSKGQITIPVAIRDRLHLRPGDVLDFDETASILVARRVIDSDTWDRNIAAIRGTWESAQVAAGRSHGVALDDLRGPVELPPLPSEDS